MRLLTFALLGLMLATGPALATAPSAPPGQVRRPGQGFPAYGPDGQIPPRPGEGPPPGPAQQAAWRPGAAPAACSRKARQCRGTAVAPARFGWTQGLPPAALVQANECPDGTLATLARGHDDVVRCMPI